MKYFLTCCTINTDSTVIEHGKYKSVRLKFYLELNIKSAANSQMRYQYVRWEVAKK